MVQLRPIVPGDSSFDWRDNTRSLLGEHAEGVGAFEGNKLVGSLTWRELPDVLYIVAAYVSPQFREQGLLKRMFSYVTSLHPDKPIKSESEQGNPVRGLQDLYNYHTTRGLNITAGIDPVNEAFSKGRGAAFFYTPDGELRWGDTHYMIFYNLSGRNSFRNPEQDKLYNSGIFGWIHPDGQPDENGSYDGWFDGKPDYDISFGTDYGYDANKENRNLESAAAKAVQRQMGYPAWHIYYENDDMNHTSGHAYESEDELNQQADSINMSGQSSCQNCGSQVDGDICGDCGTENLSWWTPLNTFKGSIEKASDQSKTVRWEEDNEFEKLLLLDKKWNDGYNSKTSSWEEEFDEPVDEDLEDFQQEVIGLTDSEKQEWGIEGPFEINGWTAYTRDCNDVYPTHDAIWIDRKNKIILIGYQGHHHDLFSAPFFQNLSQKGGWDNQTAGHFRTAPSTTEPFPAGWGWHGDSGTKEEKEVLKQVLKDHYQVDKLKDLFTPKENAEENYMDVEGKAKGD